MRLHERLPLVFLAILASLIACVQGAEPAQPVETTSLHNVFRIDGKLFSGNAPEGDAGFQELVKLGVRTIITVDGSQPDLELAHKYGLRYIHLPFGYDGVPQARGIELARAAQSAEEQGPVYLHCHHGKHRGPAAAAIICRTLDGWSLETANQFLQQAGTSPDYAGLFRDVAGFRPPPIEELKRLPGKFPESTKPAPLVDAMVAIDHHFDDLKAAQKAGWPAAAATSGQQSLEKAALLWEAFRELGRDPETKKRGDDYVAKMAASEKAANALRKLLGDAASATPARDAALQDITKSCGACHKSHRN